MPERVVINIEVNSDVATIEATREALRRLRDEHEDYNRERDRGRRTQQQTNRETQRTTHDSDALGNSLRRQARNANMLRGRYAGLLKETFALRKDIGGLIGAFGGIIGMFNKLSLIEIPLLAAGLGTITMLFKMGPSFIKLYKAAMSGLAYAAAGTAVALATVIAAQREFQSVQFAPKYTEGAANTTDRFVAASQAMRAFTGNTRLAVVGAESLQKAFGTLSKQKAVTGNTIAAFEGLMNIVAGSGGDIGKGSEKLAEFLATVQKKGLGGAGDIAKELGPDFEKVIGEAQKLGYKTSEEFFKAAAEGTLGETFQKQYAGQLDALNNTLMGRFKTAMMSLKNVIGDLGDQFLEPAGDALDKIVSQIQITITRLSPLISNFGTGFFGDIEDFIQKMSDGFVNMMNKYLNTTPTFLQQMKNIFGNIGSWFEGIQDWARQFVPAGQALIDNFFKPVWEGLTDKFSGGINVLSELVMANTDKLRTFANDIVNFIGAIGEYGNMLKEAFIAALPLMSMFLRGMTKIFELFTKLMRGVMKVFGSMGDMGKAIGAIIAIYASLTIFGRFFKTLGGMFGKDMNVRANNVFVNGRPIGGPIGGGPIGSPTGPVHGPPAPLSAGRLQGRLRGIGSSFMASPMSSLALMAGGGMLSMGGGSLSQRGQASGNALMNYGGQALSTTGNVVMAASMMRMMGVTPQTIGQITTGGGRNLVPAGLVGKSVSPTGIAASAVGAYGASKLTTNMIQDFSKGKLGKEDTLGKFGMAAAGAGAGAAAGAGIGALVGGPAAPLTAAIGAVIGTAIGGVVGYMNAGKYQKEARNAAKSMVDTFTQATDEAFAAGSIEDLTKAREELIATHEANLKNITDISTYNKTLGDFQRTLATFDKQVLTYTHNADLAARTVGIGTDEMNRLANAAGIDLKTKMLTLHDVIKLVGQTTTQQVGLMRAEWSKLSGLVVGGVFGFFEEEKNRKETAKAANAAEAALATGNFSEQQIDDFLQSGAKYAIATKGELGGLGTMIPSVEKSLTTGALKNLTDEQKKQVRDRAALAFSDDRILQSIMQSQGGMQMLKDLTATSPMLQNKSPEEMLGIIKKASGGNLGVFLENLKSAQQRALFSGNYSEVNAMLTGATGQVTAGAGRGAYGPTNVPSPAVTTNNTTVNVSGVLDKTVVDRIVYEIERINRTNRERGGITVVRE